MIKVSSLETIEAYHICRCQTLYLNFCHCTIFFWKTIYLIFLRLCLLQNQKPKASIELILCKNDIALKYVKQNFAHGYWLLE